VVLNVCRDGRASAATNTSGPGLMRSINLVAGRKCMKCGGDSVFAYGHVVRV